MTEDFVRSDIVYISQTAFKIRNCHNFEALNNTLIHQIMNKIPFSLAVFFLVQETQDDLLYFNPYYYSGDKEFNISSYINDFKKSELAKLLSFPYSTIVRGSDIFKNYYWSTSPLFRNSMGEIGMYNAVHISIIVNAIKIGFISFYRTKQEPDFTDKELSFFRLLAPHIFIRYYRLYNRQSGYQYEPHPLTPIFNILPSHIEKYKLTNSEFKVVNALLHNKTDQQICDELCIARSTFFKHIHNIYLKTNSKNRMELFQKFKI